MKRNYLNFAVIGAAHNPLGVEPDAPDELLVALEHPEAGAALDVPQPDGVIGATGDHEPVVILQTGDSSLVTIEGPHKLARAGGPHLDGPVSTGRHDVLLVKINYIHSRSEIIRGYYDNTDADYSCSKKQTGHSPDVIRILSTMTQVFEEITKYLTHKKIRNSKTTFHLFQVSILRSWS